MVAQWFTRLSLNQEVPGSRPEVDTGGALVVWPGDVGSNRLSAALINAAVSVPPFWPRARESLTDVCNG